MSILIDGYNLLNSVGIVGPAVGRGWLERSRSALLNFLAESLDPAEIPAHHGGLRCLAPSAGASPQH